MAIGERIKRIRKENKLSQVEFAGVLKISGQAVSKLENGTNNPSDQTITLICSKFGVSEEWLRTGNGSIMKAQSRDEQLIEAVNRILSGENPNFKQRLVTVLSTLDEKQWAFLENKLLEIVGVPRPAAPKNVHDWTDAEMHAELQRQLDAEKRETDESSTSFSGNSGAATA
jgi:transcriptional regulator with XRE-family HTH domain